MTLNTLILLSITNFEFLLLKQFKKNGNNYYFHSELGYFKSYFIKNMQHTIKILFLTLGI